MLPRELLQIRRSYPFALVNIAIGITVGFIAKKGKFNFVTAAITGIILAVVAPLIGTPIATIYMEALQETLMTYYLLG